MISKEQIKEHNKQWNFKVLQLLRDEIYKVPEQYDENQFWRDNITNFINKIDIKNIMDKVNKGEELTHKDITTYASIHRHAFYVYKKKNKKRK